MNTPEQYEATLRGLYPDDWARLLIPLHPSSKRPTESEWNQKAIRRWTTETDANPHILDLCRHLAEGGNIGMVLPHGVLCLDADDNPSSLYFRELLGNECYRQQSRPGHEHNLVSITPEMEDGLQALTKVKVGPDGETCDLRVGGMSQIVVEPSLHPTGSGYRWLLPPQPGPPPRAAHAIYLLISMLKGGTGRGTQADVRSSRSTPYVKPEFVAQGTQQDELWRYAMHLRAAEGVDRYDSMEVRLRGFIKDHFENPEQFREDRLKDVVRRSIRKDGRKPEASPLKIRSAAEIEVKQTEWLCWPWLPRGEIIMLQGKGGLGKSSFLCRMAARLSLGQPAIDTADEIPDGVLCRRKAYSTLYLTAEDRDSKVVERFLAYGGERSRLFVHSYSDDTNFIVEDISRLEESVKEHEIALIVFDPLSAWMGFTEKEHSTGVRARLSQIQAFAHEQHITVVCNGHMRKDRAGDAGDWGLGSVEYSNASRGVMQMHRAMDEHDRTHRWLIHAKSNLGPQARSMVYAFESNGGMFLYEPDMEAPNAWEITEKGVKQRDGKVKQAADDVIIAALKQGPQTAEQLKAFQGTIGVNTWNNTRARLAKEGRIEQKRMDVQGSMKTVWILKAEF